MRNILSPMFCALPCAVLAVGLFLPATTHASDILYEFDTPFPSDPTPTGSAPWVDAEFQDVSGGVQLTISNVGLTTGEFIQGMGNGANNGLLFNLNPSFSPNNLVFSLVSQTGNFGTSISTGEDAFKADGDGRYDIGFDFSTHNFTAGASITYLITGIPGLNAGSFAYLSSSTGGTGPFYAAAHVMGINGTNGTWIEPGSGPILVSPVPEPSSIVLMIASFGVLGGLCRWFRRKT